MAETLSVALEQQILQLKNLLWGPEIKLDIFRRWSQGFYFSSIEKSALEQSEGGPCAVIAPVQAFIIKDLLLEYQDLTFREKVNLDHQNRILVNALVEILSQCNTKTYCLVDLDVSVDSSSDINGDRNENLPSSISSCTSTYYDYDHDPNKFHEDLRILCFKCLNEVKGYYLANIDRIRGQFGVLLFLYSVILSRAKSRRWMTNGPLINIEYVLNQGLAQVKSECDSSEPLIDGTYGYGSQSVINLMITGQATTYVWDHYQDVGGLKLRGIERQSQIGFITIMEYHRFCTVGSFYKNPVHPVWVLASDTHLTVLFSEERRLVSPETKSEQARRVFKSFDPDGNNFISSDKLQDVLSALDLVSEPEYVNIMTKKLDSESLGIILLNAFMDEFFPKEESSIPDMFQLVHYNGLAQSNVKGQVQYHIGSAILLESDLKSVCESNPMLTVLQTKWPNIEVNWCDNVTPSLN